MKLWRICRRAFAHLDGRGAKMYGGRWNAEGIAVVYASTSLALAVVEYLVHLDVSLAPADLVSIEIDVPDDVSREEIDVARGDAWMSSGASCVLFVPSAVIPQSQNALLNPEHLDMARVTSAIAPFALDRRLM